jgi:type IV secretory pathway TraG/TraD family ATPase VirD4
VIALQAVVSVMAGSSAQHWFEHLLLLGLVVLPVSLKLLLESGQQERHRRGTVIRPYSRWRQYAGRWRRPNAMRLTLAGMQLAALDETKHTKLIGTTGTGKSTAIGRLLESAFQRGDRAVISDPEGSYLARWFQESRGDVVLNPFHPGSRRWDPFAEIRDTYDVEQLASALIPHSEDPATVEWRGYARTLLAAVLRRCPLTGTGTVDELWRLLTMATTDELRTLLVGTPAQPFLDPENARMFSSVRSVMTSAISALPYIQAQLAAPFSVREWVRTGCGILFIPYQAAQIPALRSIIAAWLRLAIVEAMGQPDGRDQRLWFVVDELDALGAIDGLKDALARLRKFGGRCVLGFQSIAQVSSTYGAGDAQTIVENCGNTLILRCSGSENGGTSQFASQLIGEREVRRVYRTRGLDRGIPWSMGSGRRSTQLAEQSVTEYAVLPSELEQLPDLRGFLKLASSPAWWRVAVSR